MRAFFAGIPYDLVRQQEAWYQTLFFAVFKLIGEAIDVEVRSNRGRIDAVLKTSSHIYIFEFKLEGTAQSALDQIRDKGYAESYTRDARAVVCVGLNFDKTTRNIGDWLAEPV